METFTKYGASQWILADYFNSGDKSYTTNNGTIWFRLNDTRNNSYKYNGRIWYRNQSNKYSDCTFERGGECFTFTPFHWTNSSVYVLICSFPFSCPWQASFKPHSLGQSVEWKLYPLLNLLFYNINSPTRWGNQLNGNSVQGSVESFTNTAPLAGAISWMESPKVTVKHLAPRWGAANFLRKQPKEHTITAEVKMWEGDEFKCKHCGVTPPKGHWRPITWLEKHEANCPNNPELKEQWLVSRIFTRVTKRKHQRQAPLAGAISWMETCHRVYT